MRARALRSSIDFTKVGTRCPLGRVVRDDVSEAWVTGLLSSGRAHEECVTASA